MKLVGDCLYELAERFIDIPVEPPCCSMRLTLNAYGEHLTVRHMDNITALIYSKLLKAKLPHDRLSKNLIKKFLKKAIRDSRLT